MNQFIITNLLDGILDYSLVELTIKGYPPPSTFEPRMSIPHLCGISAIKAPSNTSTSVLGAMERSGCQEDGFAVSKEGPKARPDMVEA